ncbi:19264_t:CDS:2, partial [Entrophospora sp. SA101]
MQLVIPDVIRNKCTEFVENFSNDDLNDLSLKYRHNNSWKESEEDLVGIVEEIFKALGDVWKNPAFRTNFVNMQSEDVDLDTRSSNQLKHGLSVDELEPVQSYKRRQFTVPNSQFRTTDSRTISRSTIFTNPYSRELRHAVKNIEEMQTFENSLLSIDIDGCLKENYHDITTSQTKNDTMLGSTNNTNNTISSDLILTFMALDDISKIESESFIKKKNVETNIVNDNNGGNIDAVSSDGSNSHNDVERIEVGYDDLSGIAQIMNNNFASTQSIQTSSDIQNQMEVLLNRGIFQSFESNDDVDNS